EVSFPKVVPITIVGGVAGFALSAVAILLAELFSGRALKPVGVPAEAVHRREEEDEEAVAPATVAGKPADRERLVPARSLLADIGPEDVEEETAAEAEAEAEAAQPAVPAFGDEDNF